VAEAVEPLPNMEEAVPIALSGDWYTAAKVKSLIPPQSPTQADNWGYKEGCTAVPAYVKAGYMGK